MALPLIVPVLSAASGAILTAGGMLLHSMAQPVQRDASYMANRLGTRSCPPPDMIMRLFWAGYFGDVRGQAACEVRDSLLSEHGIHPNDSCKVSEVAQGTTSPFVQMRGDAWDAFLEQSEPQIDFETLRQAWLTGNGNVSRARLNSRLIRDGIHLPEDRRILIDRSAQIPIDQLLRMYHLGLLGPLTEDELRQLLRTAGYTSATVQDRLLADTVGPTPSDTLAMLNRGTIGLPDAIRFLAAVGLRDGAIQNAVLEQRNIIPGPADLVRFAMREAWDDANAAQFGYDAEFPEPLQYWMEKQGQGWETPALDIGGKHYDAVSWPKAFWRAHWELPSPTQAYSFLQRARPTGGAGGGPRIAGLPGFTSRELSALLKTKDYPSYFRPYLEAVSYLVPDTSAIKWGRKYNLFDEAEGAEKYQDRGYEKHNAEMLSRIDTLRNAEAGGVSQQQYARAATRALIACIVERYNLGGLTYDDAKNLMMGLGISQAAAERKLLSIDACWGTNQLRRAVAAVRKSYLRGEWTVDIARQRLARAGVIPSAIDQYIAAWAIEFSPRRRQLSTGQVLHAYEHGFIDQATAGQRLANLGWDSPDAVLLGLDAQRKIVDRQTRAQAKIASNAKAAAAEVERAIKETERQRLALLRELGRIEPIGMLKRLAKHRDITEEEFVQKLRDRLIPQKAIDLYVEDVYNYKGDVKPPK